MHFSLPHLEIAAAFVSALQCHNAMRGHRSMRFHARTASKSDASSSAPLLLPHAYT